MFLPLTEHVEMAFLAQGCSMTQGGEALPIVP